jgi:uncharacterized HhH-GPD family protein
VSERVGAALLSFGRELDLEAAAQTGGGFSGIAEADELIEGSPNAFLLGVLFTQGIPAERAWAAPWQLKCRIGTLDLGYLAQNPGLVSAAIQAPPMLHRFKETVPRWVVSAARRLLGEYEGDAANIWASGSSVSEVASRLGEFDGIGHKKAAMAVEILTRHFGVELTGREHSRVAYDVHVRRVFLRPGLATEDTRDRIERAAAEICPESPGTLDLAAWLIGRDSCSPRLPHCDECRIGESCPRLVDVNVDGVGARPRAGATRRS